MKKIIFFISMVLSGYGLLAQDSTLHRTDTAVRRMNTNKDDRKMEKRQHLNTIIRQQEEGVLTYTKQGAFGIQLRTNGYGIFYERAKMKTPRFANFYAIELTEIKNNKEEKLGTGNFFSNSFVYGKINNFYQLKLGYGQQYVLGQKGNKNGIAIIAVYQAGLSAGLLKPYYIQVQDSTGYSRDVKYNSSDSSLFLDQSSIIGGGGFGKGWNEIQVRPGAYVKAALRFDFGHYNEGLNAVEIGFSVEAYAQKIQIMAYNPQHQLFFQGHIAFVLGKRK